MSKYSESNESFVNPYHFVPLEDKIAPDSNYFDFLNDDYGDAPFITGWIECKLETKSPVFIPNTTNSDRFQICGKKDKSIKSFDFFSYEDLSGNSTQDDIKPIIPGSELRGMLRSAFEALTNSCLSTTDFSKILHKRFTIPYANAGRITKNNNDWLLEPCKYERGEITKPYNPMTFQFIGEIGIKGKSSKIIFTIDKTKDTIPITSEDIQRFNQILEVYRDERLNQKLESGHTGYNNIKKDFNGALVWYEYKNGVLYISPAQIGKEVFRNNLGDLLNQHCACNSLDSLCPACLLFGIAGENDALASRIKITDAKLINQDIELKSIFHAPGILPELASPKLSATEFYLKKQKDKYHTWNYDYAGWWIDEGNEKKLKLDENYKPQIQGRKFYWHHKIDQPPYIINSSATERNVGVRPVKKGIFFSFRIYFNGISYLELKRLLWTLTIGDSHEHGHKIGMGKPIGLGSIQITVSQVKQRLIQINQNNFEYKINSLSNLMDDFKNNSEAIKLLGCNSQTLNSFKKITNLSAISRNIRYPLNEIDHHEKNPEAAFLWFTANKTDNFHPRIIQNLTEIDKSNPTLKKYKKN